MNLHVGVMILSDAARPNEYMRLQFHHFELYCLSMWR